MEIWGSSMDVSPKALPTLFASLSRLNSTLHYIKANSIEVHEVAYVCEDREWPRLSPELAMLPFAGSERMCGRGMGIYLLGFPLNVP